VGWQNFGAITSSVYFLPFSFIELFTKVLWVDFLIISLVGVIILGVQDVIIFFSV
jgi:uncharacterized membrane protein (DUF2068 family)